MAVFMRAVEEDQLRRASEIIAGQTGRSRIERAAQFHSDHLRKAGALQPSPRETAKRLINFKTEKAVLRVHLPQIKAE